MDGRMKRRVGGDTDGWSDLVLQDPSNYFLGSEKRNLYIPVSETRKNKRKIYSKKLVEI